MRLSYRFFNWKWADRLLWQYQFERGFGAEHMKQSRVLLRAQRT